MTQLCLIQLLWLIYKIMKHTLFFHINDGFAFISVIGSISLLIKQNNDISPPPVFLITCWLVVIDSSDQLAFPSFTAFIVVGAFDLHFTSTLATALDESFIMIHYEVGKYQL